MTKYGWPQVVLFPAILIAAMVICPFLIKLAPAVYAIEVVLLIILIWVLSFFRDPLRRVPEEHNVLLSPADGTVTDIELVEENEFIGGRVLRIGIFLSVFNVHINRSPCRVTVEKITYKKGMYKNAMNPESGRVNESNDVYLRRLGDPDDKLIVRQISGAIARRIVCVVKQGQQLAGGEKFGMIKFGSRTELYLPAKDSVKPMIKKGDKVKAGLTVLIRYE